MTTDVDVIQAIEQKKSQLNEIPLFVKNKESKEMIMEMDGNLWVFNHLHTVLNHAKKIFEADLNTIIEELKEELRHARKRD